MYERIFYLNLFLSSPGQQFQQQKKQPQDKPDHDDEILLRLLRPQERGHGLGHPLWSFLFHWCHPGKHSHQVIHVEVTLLVFQHTHNDDDGLYL